MMARQTLSAAAASTRVSDGRESSSASGLAPVALRRAVGAPDSSFTGSVESASIQACGYLPPPEPICCTLGECLAPSFPRIWADPLRSRTQLRPALHMVASVLEISRVPSVAFACGNLISFMLMGIQLRRNPRSKRLTRCLNWLAAKSLLLWRRFRGD